MSERAQQSNLAWTPPRWLIPWITRAQVWVYTRSNGRVGGTAAGMRHLLLHTVGRRSGKPTTACLPYWLDAQGRRVLVASFAGGPRNPAWYHNCADTAANPEVGIHDHDQRFRAKARVLAGAERDQVWADLIADRPFYAEYQKKTTRTIPLIRIEPGQPDDG